MYQHGYAPIAGCSVLNGIGQRSASR
ncbi:hypothetical protein FHX09_003362 [Rhizobium sp. BK538]|nr:hypothetical protein [Rhizobium sp. BK538]